MHGRVANFSFFTAVCFTINYIVGCGFLSIPHAFVESGIIVGPALCIFFAWACNVTKDYILEALGRLEAITKVEETGQGEFQEGDFIITTRKFELADAAERLVGKWAKITYIVLLSFYMYGLLWAYPSVFGTSFASQLPSPFHGTHACEGSCEGPVRFYIAIFGLIVVPMSCIDLEEQVVVQVLMSAARVIVMAMMVGTVFAALACDGQAFNLPDFTHRHMESPGAYHASGLNIIIPRTVYASIFHYSIPVLAQPVKNKLSLKSVFAVGFAFTTFVYVALGVVLALYFGDAVKNITQVNLYWRYYEGCKSSPDAHTSAWAQFAKFIILIFPALDVMSAYPLNAMTLGNNLMVAFTGHDSPTLAEGESWWAAMGFGKKHTHAPLPQDDADASGGTGSINNTDGDLPGITTPMLEGSPPHVERVTPAEKHRLFRLKLLFRLVASVPSLVGSLFESNLGTILDTAGTVAIVIAFVVPAVLRHESIRKCVAVAKRAETVSDSGPEAEVVPTGWWAFLFPSTLLGLVSKHQRDLIKTPYDSLLSTDWMQHVMFVMGVAVFLYIFVLLF